MSEARHSLVIVREGKGFTSCSVSVSCFRPGNVARKRMPTNAKGSAANLLITLVAIMAIQRGSRRASLHQSIEYNFALELPRYLDYVEWILAI